ncbi:hypothetical protein LCGC14_0594760 [marine sediment metagenome]|uniref:Uncharacterized protein n=1 Tax=marine sediment metagenome TaxID=412755 RepID=A0A0F9UKP6_9ZZZZ|nr:hypothetical protein [bacterium]
MIVKYRMPKRHLETLKEFTLLSKKQKDIYLKLTDSISPELTKNEIKDLTKLSDEEFDKFFGYLIFIISLYLNFYRFNKPLSIFINEVIMDSAKNHDIKLESEEKVRELIEIVIKMDKNIGILSKSINLSTDNQNIFFDARILTNVRHLFYNDIEKFPNYVLIQHLFRLSYVKNATPKDMFFNLNYAQLLELKDIIDRAIIKENTIKKTYKEKEIITLREVEWYE